MSILVDAATRVLVQGITGREGTFHALRCREYGTQMVGGVTPGKGGTTHEGFPVWNTVADAVRATGVAFNSAVGAGQPISADQLEKDERIWVVAYFGVSGSSPEAWVVTDVERAGGRVRLSFRYNGAETDDLKPYFVWAPLGPLGAGTYTLELYDAGGREVVLSRTVRLPK